MRKTLSPRGGEDGDVLRELEAPHWNDPPSPTSILDMQSPGKQQGALSPPMNKYNSFPNQSSFGSHMRPRRVSARPNPVRKAGEPAPLPRVAAGVGETRATHLTWAPGPGEYSPEMGMDHRGGGRFGVDSQFSNLSFNRANTGGAGEVGPGGGLCHPRRLMRIDSLKRRWLL